MEKKALISIAVVLIFLASVSTFYDFSRGMSGEFVTPAVANVYFILTALALIGISIFLLMKEK